MKLEKNQQNKKRTLLWGFFGDCIFSKFPCFKFPEIPWRNSESRFAIAKSLVKICLMKFCNLPRLLSVMKKKFRNLKRNFVQSLCAQLSQSIVCQILAQFHSFSSGTSFLSENKTLKINIWFQTLTETAGRRPAKKIEIVEMQPIFSFQTIAKM